MCGSFKVRRRRAGNNGVTQEERQRVVVTIPVKTKRRGEADGTTVRLGSFCTVLQTSGEALMINRMCTQASTNASVFGSSTAATVFKIAKSNHVCARNGASLRHARNVPLSMSSLPSSQIQRRFSRRTTGIDVCPRRK